MCIFPSISFYRQFWFHCDYLTLICRHENYCFATFLSLQATENCTATADIAVGFNATSGTLTNVIDPSLFPEKIFCNFYTEWTTWSKCNKKCIQKRKRKCRKKDVCGKSSLEDKRACTNQSHKCLNHKLIIMNSSDRNRRIEDRLYDIFFHSWSAWSSCNSDCKRRRRRKCKTEICTGGFLQEERSCANTSDCKRIMSLQVHSNKSKKGCDIIVSYLCKFIYKHIINLWITHIFHIHFRPP